jgi:hypothetical protein
MEQERQPTSVALGLGLRGHGSGVGSYRSLRRCLETTRLLLNAQIISSYVPRGCTRKRKKLVV